MVRQPKWVIDEVILAMDTYFQIGSVHNINPKNPLVVDLQRTLRSLPIHEGHKSEDKFRNLNGITMILLNIASLDENAQYSLRHAAKLQYLVWDYYKNKKDYLNAVARAIRYCLPLPFKYCVNTDIDQLGFMQGTILYQFHRFIELETKEAKGRRKEAIESGQSSCAFVA